MRIAIVPNAFKGSLTAPQAADCIARGLQKALPACSVVKVPIADGGDGTAGALVAATGGAWVACQAHDPLGRLIRSGFGLTGDGRTAVIEMAQASGLALLAQDERNPLLASTYGTGELIRAALDLRVGSILIGIGGSAIEVEAERLQRVRCTRFGAGGAIAMFGDRHARRRHDNRDGGRYVQCMLPVAAGAAHVDGVGRGADRDHPRTHRPRGFGDLDAGFAAIGQGDQERLDLLLGGAAVEDVGECLGRAFAGERAGGVGEEAEAGHAASIPARAARVEQILLSAGQAKAQALSADRGCLGP